MNVWASEKKILFQSTNHGIHHNQMKSEIVNVIIY